MARSGATAILVLACLVLATALPRAAPARPAAAPPVVLLVHGGGFIFDQFGLPAAARAARRLGFEPRFVSYPSYDLAGAIEAVRVAAATARGEGRAVYAYGESVGGTMAALLAQGRRVRAAATYCPIARLRQLIARSGSPRLYRAIIGASDDDLREASPGRFDARRPILALRAVDDRPFVNRSIRVWDRRDPEVESVAVPGGHLRDPEHPAAYERNVRLAIRWLASAAGL